MKQIIPINATKEGIAPCVPSHYYKAGFRDFMPKLNPLHIPHLAMLEIEMVEPKPIQVAQIYDQEQDPINGRVYSDGGIAPTLRTPTGGLSQPKIMQIGSYSPSSSCNAKALDADGICPTLLDHKGAEPAIVIGSMQANAMRGSIDGVSPCLTEAMGMGGGQIPMIVQNAHGYNKGGVFEDVAPTVTSSAYQDNNHVVEPSILGYTRDDKGGIQNYHEREVAGTIHTSSGSGGNTDQFVKELITRKGDIAFREMPDGNIHAYRASDPKKSTAPEWQITIADNVHPTITTSHEPKVLLKYRIRKLTPTECFRLMGVDDSDIDKLKSATLSQTLKSGKVKESPIPKTQLYKMAGNSIVVDVLYHIFHQMFIAEPPKPKPIQKSLFDDL